MDIFWFLHNIGEISTIQEYKKLLCAGQINVNGISLTLKQGMDYNCLKSNDIVSMGEYQGKVWLV